MEEKIDFSENRNIFMPNKKMKICLLNAVKKVYEYPDYKNISVNTTVAEYFNIPYENVSVTNGSIEAINLLTQVLNKNKATLFKPTFWGYEDALKRYRYHVNSKNLKNNLKYDIDDIEQNAKKSDIIFLCNPNNPTLDYIEKEVLIKIIKNNPNCHFVIDETMLIFDKEFSKKSIIKYICECDNLSVIISFSKFLGIAGLRTGAVFSNDEIITKIKQQKTPYSFGIIQQEILPCAFSEKEYLEKTKILIGENKEILCAKLKNIGCEIIDCNTNYVLVKLPPKIDANEITMFLLENNIIVRNIKEAYKELEGDWIRVSINTNKNNKLLVEKLEFALNNYKIIKEKRR